jgi:hypothetical protein
MVAMAEMVALAAMVAMAATAETLPFRAYLRHFRASMGSVSAAAAVKVAPVELAACRARQVWVVRLDVAAAAGAVPSRVMVPAVAEPTARTALPVLTVARDNLASMAILVVRDSINLLNSRPSRRTF